MAEFMAALIVMTVVGSCTYAIHTETFDKEEWIRSGKAECFLQTDGKKRCWKTCEVEEP